MVTSVLPSQSFGVPSEHKEQYWCGWKKFERSDESVGINKFHDLTVGKDFKQQSIFEIVTLLEHYIQENLN